MVSVLRFCVALLLYTIMQCNALWCNDGAPSCGPCTADGTCQLNCGNINHRCQNALLTCKDGEDCDIDCTTASAGVCQGATIAASDTIDVIMDCEWTDSCRTANVTCGTGVCTITCNQQTSCKDMVVDATNTQQLRINCWLTDSCNGIDVTCGPGSCYMNCGESKNGQSHCNNMKLTCGTGDCTINCEDEGYRQCVGITVDTTLAKSFKCIGNSDQCFYSPAPFTAAPTTTSTEPTTYQPTTYQPTTTIPTIFTTTSTEPTTYQPTAKPTRTAVSVSVEISIIASNVTNGTIKDTFTDIINDYLITHLEVSGDFSLSVDVVENNRVIVTVSTKDIAAFNETQLVSYIDTQLQNTDIRIFDGNIETTNNANEELMNTDAEDDEPLIIIYVLVIVITILVVGCLILVMVYKKKQNRKVEPDKKKFTVLECSPQSTGTGSPPVIAMSQMKLTNAHVNSNSTNCDEENGESGDDMYTEQDGEDIHNTPKYTPKTPTVNGVDEIIDTPTLNGIKESIDPTVGGDLKL